MTAKLTFLALALVTSAILACSDEEPPRDYRAERVPGAVCSTSLPPVGDCGNLCDRGFWTAISAGNTPITDVVRSELACEPSGIEFTSGVRTSPLSFPIALLHDPEIVGLLLSNGANPNVEFETIITDRIPPLITTVHLVNVYSIPGIPKSILERYEQGYADEQDGVVPKWVKQLNADDLERNSLENARLLLEYGADPTIVSEKYEITPLFTFVARATEYDQRAYDGGYNPELMDLLLEHGAGASITKENSEDYVYALFFAEADAWVIERLLNHGLDPLAGDGMWLHLAAKFGKENPETYQTFIDAGMDPLALDEDGMTACEVLTQEPPPSYHKLTSLQKGRELDLSAVEEVLCGQ